MMQEGERQVKAPAGRRLRAKRVRSGPPGGPPALLHRGAKYIVIISKKG